MPNATDFATRLREKCPQCSQEGGGLVVENGNIVGFRGSGDHAWVHVQEAFRVLEVYRRSYNAAEAGDESLAEQLQERADRRMLELLDGLD